MCGRAWGRLRILTRDCGSRRIRQSRNSEAGHGRLHKAKRDVAISTFSVPLIDIRTCEDVRLSRRKGRTVSTARQQMRSEQMAIKLSKASERLAEMMRGVRDVCTEFFEKHASIRHVPTRTFGGETKMTPWGPKRVGGGVSMGYSSWEPLSPNGTQTQAGFLSQYQKFVDLARTLLTGQPQKVLDQFSECDEIILASVQQQGWPRGGTTHEVSKKVQDALECQQSFVGNLYDGSDDSVVIVPDTNALLYNASLEEWEFDGIPCFTMILTPTATKELDKLKITAREDFRKRSTASSHGLRATAAGAS
jgi:hypothetical protein